MDGSEEIRLGWEEDRAVIQRIRGGVAIQPVDRPRPTRLAAQVEALRRRDKLISEKYELIDPTTPRLPSPSDRRNTPLFAEPPWRDPEAALVEADRLLELDDALAEVVHGAPQLIWRPEVLGRLSDMESLIALELECGHVRAASIAAHLPERELMLALKKLFGVGSRGYLLEVILDELASLEITRHLERLTLCGFGAIYASALDPLRAFVRLRELTIQPSPLPKYWSSLVLDSVPEWMMGLEELRLFLSFNAARLLEQGAPIRLLTLNCTSTANSAFFEMTPARWPNLTELVLRQAYRTNELVSALRDSGMLSQLKRLDLEGCSVGALGGQSIERDIASFPELVVLPPKITDPTERRIAGLDAHPLQAPIDALAGSSELAYEARRIAFARLFRDSGGDEEELWGYTEHGLTELRLSDGHTTCECGAAQPCVHALALMYDAVRRGIARWLTRP